MMKPSTMIAVVGFALAFVAGCFLALWYVGFEALELLTRWSP